VLIFSLASLCANNLCIFCRTGLTHKDTRRYLYGNVCLRIADIATFFQYVVFSFYICWDSECLQLFLLIIDERCSFIQPLTDLKPPRVSKRIINNVVIATDTPSNPVVDKSVVMPPPPIIWIIRRLWRFKLAFTSIPGFACDCDVLLTWLASMLVQVFCLMEDILVACLSHGS
jgi:hypothetical protein